MSVNKDAFANYKEPTIMAGRYPVRVVGVDNRANKAGVDMGVLTCKILDEVPYGKVLDEDEKIKKAIIN